MIKSKSFQKLFWLLTVVYLFTFFGFFFFDLLGIRRMVQGIVGPIIFFLGFLLISKKPKISTPSFFAKVYLIGLSIFGITAMALRFHSNELFSILFAVFVILILHFDNFIRKHEPERQLIYFVSFFAAMALFQFLVLLNYPDMIFGLNHHGDVLYENQSNDVWSSFAYMGTTSGGTRELAGQRVFRLKSFMNEPSLAVAYFLMPAGLAFSFPGKLKYLGMIPAIFAFATLAGTSYFALFVGVFGIVFFIITRGNRFIFFLFPPLILFFISFICDQGYFWELFELINYPAQELGLKFLAKAPESAAERFFANIFVINEILVHPLGTTSQALMTHPVGSFLGAFFLFGPIGFLWNILLYFMLLNNLYAWLKKGSLSIFKILSGCFIYGSFYVSFGFVWYGFLSGYGYVLLFLVGERLNKLRTAE